MAKEGVNLDANLNTSMFMKGIDQMGSAVSRFGRMAPRMAAGAISGGIAGGISGTLAGGGAAALGFGGIQADVAASRGFLGVPPGEIKALDDLGREKAASIIGAMGRFEADQDAMRMFTQDPEVYKRMGFGGYQRGDTSLESLLRSLDTVHGMQEGEMRRFYIQQLGLKELVDADIDRKMIEDRLGYPRSEIGAAVHEEGEEQARLAERSRGGITDVWNRFWTGVGALFQDIVSGEITRGEVYSRAAGDFSEFPLGAKPEVRLSNEDKHLLQRTAQGIEDIREMGDR